VADDARPEAGGLIEIVLASGQRVHVMAPVDREALADVLAVLEGPAMLRLPGLGELDRGMGAKI
jgi:hypothetical protein